MNQSINEGLVEDRVDGVVPRGWERSRPIRLSSRPPSLQFKTKYGKRVLQVTVTVNDSLYNSTNGSLETVELSREEMIPVPGQVNGVNALGLVVFSMCFGLIIGNMKEQGQLLREFFDSLNEAIMRLVAIIMW